MTAERHPEQIPEALEIAYRLHGEWVKNEAELAAISGVPEIEVREFLRDPITLARLEAEAIKAEADGSINTVLARRASTNFLRTILRYSKEADVSEIPDLHRVLSRVLDQADRVRLAEKGTENLRTISVTFGAEFLETKFITPENVPEFVGDITPKQPIPKPITVADINALDLFPMSLTPLKIDRGEGEK